ncbi:15653_t:CDS:2, partial [Dentiscutata heterogama]
MNDGRLQAGSEASKRRIYAPNEVNNSQTGSNLKYDVQTNKENRTLCL